MSDCELLETCGFFKKYKSSLEMACRGFLKTYCHGDQMNECKRKEFRKENASVKAADKTLLEERDGRCDRQ
jgi:hypothetical protein